MARQKMPGEGSARCLGTTRSGLPCRNNEIEGLEYCLHHVPGDLLDEAEQVTGWRRCRYDGCAYYAVAGSDPPACKVHGVNLGSVRSKRASARVVQLRTDGRAAVIASRPDNATSLLDPPPVLNPLQALLDKAAVACEWEQITRRALAYLGTSNWRYSNSRMGEQTRAEILLHQQALNQCLTTLERICRLNLDAKLAGIRQQTADMLDQALAAALEQSGCGLDGQARARDEFRRRLTIVA